MPALAISPLDVLVVLGLGLAGFLVVAVVCALVLALLQVVLPRTDSGAEAAASEAAGASEAGRDPADPGLAAPDPADLHPDPRAGVDAGADT